MSALRISPSGEPILNDDGGGFVPGEGMVMRAALASANIADGFSVSGTGVIEIKDDPSTALAPFMRPSFENCQLGTRYGAELVVTLRTQDSWNTAVVTLAVDGSIDDGVSWIPLTATAFVVPGVSGAGNGNQNTCDVEVPGILGSDITGLVDGGSLTLRATLQGSAVPASSLGFAGQATLGDAPGQHLKLTEQL